jgi:hypothetical protein
MARSLPIFCCADADGYRANDQDIICVTKASRSRLKISDPSIEVPDYANVDNTKIVDRAIVWVWLDQTASCLGLNSNVCSAVVESVRTSQQ